MPRKCCMPECKGNYSLGPKVSVFKFPLDENLRRKWIQAVHRNNFVPSEYTAVCEKHFQPHDIERSVSLYDSRTGKQLTAPLDRPRLKKGAIPSLLLGCPSYLSKPSTSREDPEERRQRLENDSIRSAIAKSLSAEERRIKKTTLVVDIKKKQDLPERGKNISSLSQGPSGSGLEALQLAELGFPMEFDANVINSDNHQMDIKVKIKEEPVCPNGTLTQIKSECEQTADFHSETVFVSCLANDSTNSIGIDCNGMLSKIEIKEETCWSENASNEIKHEMELSYAADNCLQNEIKETAVNTEEATTEDTARFHTESLCRIGDNATHFFTNTKSGNDSCKNNDCDPHSASDLLNCSQPQALEESKTKDALDLGVNTCSLTHNCKTPHKCEICGKSFRFLSDLKSHSISHEDIKTFKCGICEKRYAEETNLKEHQLIHKGKVPHTCGICNKDFTELLHLKRHILTHEGKRPYTCKICNKSFIRVSHLKCHILTHEGKRLHTCKICNKKFTQGSHLKSHILTHEGKRPHTCEICKKSFTRVYGLKTHKLIHEDKRPYECETCKRAFIHKSSLKQHELTHESTKSHACEICSKRYTHVSTLRRHKLIHEGKI